MVVGLTVIPPGYHSSCDSQWGQLSTSLLGSTQPGIVYSRMSGHSCILLAATCRLLEAISYVGLWDHEVFSRSNAAGAECCQQPGRGSMQALFGVDGSSNDCC